jgi:hypothetical protein
MNNMIKYAENIEHFIDINEVVLDSKNAKIHTEKHITQIANSIRLNGYLAGQEIGIGTIKGQDPICFDGNGRLMAMKLLGEKQIPCYYTDFDSELHRMKISVIINATTLETGFKKDVVKELYELIKLEPIELAMMQEIDLSVLEPLKIDAMNLCLDNPEAFYEKVNQELGNKVQDFSNKNQEIDIDNIDTSECKIVFKYDALMYESILHKINNLKQKMNIDTNELLLLELLKKYD